MSLSVTAGAHVTDVVMSVDTTLINWPPGDRLPSNWTQVRVANGNSSDDVTAIANASSSERAAVAKPQKLADTLILCQLLTYVIYFTYLRCQNKLQNCRTSHISVDALTSELRSSS